MKWVGLAACMLFGLLATFSVVICFVAYSDALSRGVGSWQYPDAIAVVKIYAMVAVLSFFGLAVGIFQRMRNF